jgi:hypothetical protein
MTGYNVYFESRGILLWRNLNPLKSSSAGSLFVP